MLLHFWFVSGDLKCLRVHLMYEEKDFLWCEDEEVLVEMKIGYGNSREFGCFIVLENFQLKN